VAVSIIDQEIISLLSEIISVLNGQQQTQAIDKIQEEVNGLVGLIGQTFAQSLSNGYKLDQLAHAVAPLPSAIKALGSPMQSGEPVTLSTGGQNSLVNAIWLFTDSWGTQPAYTWLAWAGELAYQHMLTDGLTVTTQPFLKLLYNNLTNAAGFQKVSPNAPLDWHTIQAGDATPIAWVEREYSTYGWQPMFNFPTDTVYYPDAINANALWVLRMTQPEFDLLKLRLYPTGGGTAPIWPGIAKVTLGSAVAITPPTQSLAGPMAGILLDITGGTANLPHFVVGAMDSWKAVGTLMFESDHGEAETFQLLGPRQAIYTPRTMAQAQSAQFKFIPGLTGTITPWTVMYQY